MSSLVNSRHELQRLCIVLDKIRAVLARHPLSADEKGKLERRLRVPGFKGSSCLPWSPEFSTIHTQTNALRCGDEGGFLVKVEVSEKVFRIRQSIQLLVYAVNWAIVEQYVPSEGRMWGKKERNSTVLA